MNVETLTRNMNRLSYLMRYRGLSKSGDTFQRYYYNTTYSIVIEKETIRLYINTCDGVKNKTYCTIILTDNYLYLNSDNKNILKTVGGLNNLKIIDSNGLYYNDEIISSMTEEEEFYFNINNSTEINTLYQFYKTSTCEFKYSIIITNQSWSFEQMYLENLYNYIEDYFHDNRSNFKCN